MFKLIHKFADTILQNTQISQRNEKGKCKGTLLMKQVLLLIFIEKKRKKKVEL